MQAVEFWDNLFAQGDQGYYSRVEMPDINDPVLKRALEHFGNVENKTVVDLGCGRGATSLFFAHKGANVISIDSSEIAIKNLTEYCLSNSITNIKPIKLNAQEISALGKVDFVFGSMILHHIEPFSEFAMSLRDIVKLGGAAFFWENNARSELLIWFRKNVVGKLWIPKYGDPDEFPLTVREVGELKAFFEVQIEYPVMHFFRMISPYLLRGKFRKPFVALDNLLYRFPSIRQYSYRQYLLLRNI